MNIEFHYHITWLIAAISNIGHAEAGHNPDEIALIWKDTRLIEKRVDNRKRFLTAAAQILRKLAKFADSRMTEKELQKKETALKKVRPPLVFGLPTRLSFWRVQIKNKFKS